MVRVVNTICYGGEGGGWGRNTPFSTVRSVFLAASSCLGAHFRLFSLQPLQMDAVVPRGADRAWVWSHLLLRLNFKENRMAIQGGERGGGLRRTFSFLRLRAHVALAAAEHIAKGLLSALLGQP